jgi:beta-lactam-binding protein with PASTA domain
MPKIFDLSLEEAQEVLLRARLRYTLAYAPNLIVPEGFLFAVSPPPGTTLTDESKIVLSVSSGPPKRSDQD